MEPRGTSTVLLVDSDGAVADRIGGPLDAHGFETVVVESASACLEQIEATDFAAVVSVYELPDLDGLRLLRSIRVTHPTLPFVLAPVDGPESLASEAMAAGVSHFVAPDESPKSIVEQLGERIEQPKPWPEDESGRRYRHLVQSAPVPINLFDETGESIWCNNAVLELLELESRDDLIGHSIFQFIHPDDQELATQELEAVIEDKVSIGPTRMKLRTKTGKTRHVIVSTAIGSFLGEDIGQASMIDVTDLRETRQELEDERDFIENALGALDDLFYIVDTDGELLRWNESVKEITGYDAASLQSMRAAEFFAKEDRHKIERSLRAIRETGSDTVEGRLETAGGKRIPYEFRGRLLESGQSEPETRIVGTGRDISHRKERERQLLVLERWLRHNIRNELNLIIGRADLIRRGEGAEPREHAVAIQETAESLVKQAEHQRKVVDIVADPSQPIRLELGSLVRSILEELHNQHPAADIELRRTDEVEVFAIPEFRYVVRELVGNAIIHNDAESPYVGIDVEERDSVGVLRIEDDGPGIPDIEQVDFSIDREMDQLVHSSGLGLFVSHWAVHTSDGTIDVSEKPARGSVVTISLPRAEPE